MKRYLVKPGSRVKLDKLDPGSTEAVAGEDAAKAELARDLGRLASLQGRLWGEGKRALLVVLQAMDSGGKDGTIKHVFAGVNPVGVRVTNFKKPSEDELRHDFLWRCHKAVPATGEIGIFNRSHYEAVLVERVRQLVPEAVWRKRYRQIRDFERLLVESGTTVRKFFLHISRKEQKERLAARLADPEKGWKIDPSDLGDRARWDDYVAAYEDALAETSTDEAPWYVVPADHKWYRNLVVARVLVEALVEMDPRLPPAKLPADTKID